MKSKNNRLRRAALLALPVVMATATVAQAASHMRTTGRTSQPIGHYEYCQTYVADCSIVSADTRPVLLSRARWAEMVAVNDQVNRKIHPVTDMDYYHREEFWTYPDQYGDCEDYVLAKRSLLMQRGWPATSLLVTVVRQNSGEGHAVLTVRTDQADYVLDNLNDKILSWDDTDYQYLKRQAARNSGQWEGISDERSTVVGSVRK